MIFCTQLELESSNSLLGYRAMWQLLRSKYGVEARRCSDKVYTKLEMLANNLCKRDKIMMLLKVADPVGNEIRKKKRLQRRIYRSKVCNYCVLLCWYYFFISMLRGPTTYGTWMGMINCHPMV